jgi:hypothetical protein
MLELTSSDHRRGNIADSTSASVLSDEWHVDLRNALRAKEFETEAARHREEPVNLCPSPLERLTIGLSTTRGT